MKIVQGISPSGTGATTMHGMTLETGEVIGRCNPVQEGPVRLRRYRSDVHPEAGAPGVRGH
eukprot:1040994-Pyramimonas_sp.AAC.1